MLLHGDVLLLQLTVVLQQPGLPHFVLSDVIAQLTALQLRQLGVLSGQEVGQLDKRRDHQGLRGLFSWCEWREEDPWESVVAAGEMKSDTSVWPTYQQRE